VLVIGNEEYITALLCEKKQSDWKLLEHHTCRHRSYDAINPSFFKNESEVKIFF